MGFQAASFREDIPHWLDTHGCVSGIARRRISKVPPSELPFEYQGPNSFPFMVAVGKHFTLSGCNPTT